MQFTVIYSFYHDPSEKPPKGVGVCKVTLRKKDTGNLSTKTEWRISFKSLEEMMAWTSSYGSITIKDDDRHLENEDGSPLPKLLIVD